MKPEAYNPVRGYMLVMKNFASQDPRSYSLYFDLNICFRARKVIGTLEKRAPGALNQRLFLSQRFLKLADFQINIIIHWRGRRNESA